jgi:nucleoside-diphosphate-sugar epimerase
MPHGNLCHNPGYIRFQRPALTEISILSMPHILSDKKILVTGGTGFIGGRVVEKLVQECNASVRVMLRNFARALHIARYPIELVYGDMDELGQVTAAAVGCDIIVHCAYGSSGDDQTRRSVNVLGTRNVLEAGLRAGVKRLVHLSTVQVYGALPDGDFDETWPRRYFGDSYSDSKLDAEEIVREYIDKHGLPAVILQPTIVYGPNSLIWTAGLLSSLRKERHILVDRGDGFCNAVYVDDVADAIVLAAVRDEVVGESFLISGAQPVTWRDFYASYEKMLGISATIAMSAAEAEAYDVKNRNRGPSIFTEGLSILRQDPILRQRLIGTRELALVKRVASSLLPEDIRGSMKRRIKGENGAVPLQNGPRDERPIRLLSFPLDAKFYRTRARVRIDKARRLLGYEPAFDLALGMKCTELWARWAKLLPSSKQSF